MGIARKAKSLLQAAWGRLGVRRRRHRRQMLEMFRRVPRSPGKPRRVLFWVPGGMPLMLHVEGAVAAALASRGVEVHAVICDGPFRACVRREISAGKPVSEWAKECKGCRRDSASVLDSMGIPYSFIG